MANIRVELELADGQFITRMIHAGETVDQFNRNVGQTYVQIKKLDESHRSFLSTLRDVVVIFGTVGQAFNTVRSITTGWIGDIIKTNAEIQKTQTLLSGMAKSADPVKEAAGEMKRLRDFAKEAPYSLATLTKSFVQMKASGLDPMAGSLKGLVDATAAMGGSDAQLGRASLAIQQMSGKGVIQMEELRQQLGEAVPRAAELMARSMGVSYDVLVKAISTGTVQAKPALELLRMEFDRTFGGAAKRQMETYDGLVSQIGSAFQDLQRKVGGDVGSGGFFDAVLVQLKDFLALLQSPQAGAFAEKLGSALTTVMGYIRAAAETVFKFKNEIIDLGKAIGLAFITSRAIGGLLSLGAAIGSVTAGITMMSANYQAKTAILNASTFSVEASRMAHVRLAESQARAAIGAATMGDTFRAFGNQMLGLNPLANAQGTLMQRLASSTNLVGSAARFATVAIAGLSVTLNFVVGWLPLLVTGVMLAGEKFGWFKDRAKEAREELSKFTPTSQKQVLDAFDATIAQKEAELKALQKSQAYLNAHYSGTGMMGARQIGQRELDAKEGELTGLKDNKAALLALAKVNEAKVITDAEMRILDGAQAQRQAIYDRQRTAHENFYKAERAKLIEANQSTAGIDAAYQAVGRDLERKSYTDQLAAQQAFIDKQLALTVKGTDDQKAQAIANVTAGKAAMGVTQEALSKWEESKGGIPFLQKAANEAKAIEKIKAQILSVQGASEGMKAEIAGASSEAAKLVYELENSSKIPRGNPAIEQLIADLKVAIGINDDLEKKLKGRQEFDRDIQSVTKKLMEERFELENRHLSEVEKIELKAKIGLYGPLTGQIKSADTAVSALAASNKTLGDAMGKVQDITGRLGDSITKAFEGEPKTAIEKAAALIATVGDNLARLKTLSDGLDLSKSFTTMNAGGGGALQQRASFGLGEGGVQTAVTGYSQKDLDLTIRTMLAEARGESAEGLQAVAEVIRNRSQVSGRSMSQIVTDPKQFSPWNTAGSVDKMMSESTSSADYQRAAETLKGVLEGTLQSVIGSRTSFANPGASDPVNQAGWIASAKNQLRIGNHVFSDAGYGGRQIDRDASQLSGNDGGTGDADKLIEAKIAEMRNKALRAQTEYTDFAGKMEENITSVVEDSDALGKHYRDLREKIQKKDGNTFNPDGRKIDDPYWDDLKKKAELADAADKAAQEAISKRRKSTTAEEAISKRLEDGKENLDRSTQQVRDPYSYKNSDAYMGIERASRRDLATVEAGGGNTDGARAQAEATKNQAIQDDINRKAAGFAKESDLLNQSMMTEYQARQVQLDNNIRLLDSYLAAYQAAGGTEVATTEAIERKKAALRQQAAMAGPFAQQMKQFGDLGANLEKGMTSWMGSFNDKFTTMITTGKMNFRDLTQSILADIVKIGLQWAESQIFKSLMNFGMSAITGGASNFAGQAAGAMGPFMPAATGYVPPGYATGKVPETRATLDRNGVIEGPGTGTSDSIVARISNKEAIIKASSVAKYGSKVIRAINEGTFDPRKTLGDAFSAMPKFAVGRVMKALGGGMPKDAIPAVAQSIKGAFSDAEMGALTAGAGSNSVTTIAPVVHLTASGGTAEQNNDLAGKVGKQLTDVIEGMIGKSMRNAMRPGGMLRQ